MPDYNEFLTRAKTKHGGRFDTSNLAEQFIPYFQSGQRIKVQYGTEQKTGTVGVTTGWRPCFLLMRRSNAIGSIYTLSARDRILAVKHGRKWSAI